MTREDEVRAAYTEGLKDMASAVRKGLGERDLRSGRSGLEIEVDVEEAWLASDAFKGLGEPVE